MTTWTRLILKRNFKVNWTIIGQIWWSFTLFGFPKGPLGPLRKNPSSWHLRCAVCGLISSPLFCTLPGTNVVLDFLKNGALDHPFFRILISYSLSIFENQQKIFFTESWWKQTWRKWLLWIGNYPCRYRTFEELKITWSIFFRENGCNYLTW